MGDISPEEAALAIRDNALKYLATKASLDNMSATSLTDAYYTSLNSTVQLEEITYNLGRLTLNLPTPLFGSSNQVVIPNSSLLGGIFLHLVLNINGIANLSLPRGWGYAFINSINYQLGSSNANQQQIQGQSVIQIVAAQCGSEEKFSEFIRLAGDAVTTTQSAPIEANVFLPYPFSTACGVNQKLPFDTDLLSSPLYLTINFSQAGAVFGGSGTPPTSFTSAQLVTRQGDFYNKDVSFGSIMKRNSSLMYNYPFIHHQSIISPLTSGTPAPVGGTASPCVVQLLSILNADLIGLSFYVVLASDVSPTGGNSPNPLNLVDCMNIQLLFNGQVMYSAPDNLAKLYQSYMIDGAGFFQGGYMSAGTTSPFTFNPADMYIYHIDFSRRREACYGHEFANVWRIGNNTLSLSFNPNPKNASGAQNYYIYVTYHYNGLASISGGESRLLY